MNQFPSDVYIRDDSQNIRCDAQKFLEAVKSLRVDNSGDSSWFLMLAIVALEISGPSGSSVGVFVRFVVNRPYFIIW